MLGQCEFELEGEAVLEAFSKSSPDLLAVFERGLHFACYGFLVGEEQ